MDALPFLAKLAAQKPQPVYVLHGDEDFLKSRCRKAVLGLVLPDSDPAFAVATFAGEKLAFSTVRNELDTLAFFSPRRVVVVENADPFVTEHRGCLERYIAKPSAVGVLILEAKTFPETTKLAKGLPDAAKIACKSPSAYKLGDVEAWCRTWCPANHGKALDPDAAAILVERVGPQYGLLDQELAKLAVAVGSEPAIRPENVERFVGRSRAANVFRILDAVGEGKPGEAFTILAELLEEGEDPLAILGPLSASLRKLAAVNRLVMQGTAMGPALDAAGVPKWPAMRQGAERQLRHLGRQRLAEIPDWLVEINFGLKGGSPLKPRMQLEMLLTKLARPKT